jgi:tetratricopeptide (TPR) repeat protein
MVRFFSSRWDVDSFSGALVRNILLRPRSAFRSLRHPWLRDLHDAPQTNQHPNGKIRIVPSLLLALLIVATPLVGGAQEDTALKQEQAAIESGEDLSARAKKALFRARSKQDDGDFEGAAEVMSEFLAGQPDRDHPLLLFNLALSHFALEQDVLAFEDLAKAVELEPRYGRGWLRLGEAAYNLEKYAEAGEAFSKAYDLTPERTPEILYYSGVSLLTGKKVDRALTVLEKLLEEHRDGADLDWYQALISAGSEAGKPGRVAPFLDNLLADNASVPRAWELGYQFAASREDYRTAAVCLTIAGYLRPLTREETIQLGDIYAVISVPLQAARYYEKAMDMPGTGQSIEAGRAREFERLASAWLGAHDHERARATLQTAIGEKETVGLWSLLGDLEYLDEDFEAALKAFGHACDLDPDFGRGWLMMGYCAIELERPGEARRHLNKAATYPGLESSARSLLGRVDS